MYWFVRGASAGGHEYITYTTSKKVMDLVSPCDGARNQIGYIILNNRYIGIREGKNISRS